MLELWVIFAMGVLIGPFHGLINTCVLCLFLGTLAVFALRFLCSLPLEADAAIAWVNSSLAHSLPSQTRGPLYLAPLAV